MKINGKHYLTIWHDDNDNNVHIIDQTKLPFEFKIKKLETFQDGYNAIKDMLVRGAPLIGVTAAYGVAISLLSGHKKNDLEMICSNLLETRPTAVNLFWALKK